MIVHLKKGGDDAASRVYSLPWNDLQKSEEKGKREWVRGCSVIGGDSSVLVYNYF